MSKAVLVLDMPESCYDCCLHNYHFCDVTCSAIDFSSRPDDCPLESLPAKRKERYAADVGDRDSGFIDGWNACIYEIMYRSEK